MSALTDVLAKHQYRASDRSCTCEENWYDLRPSSDRDLIEHALHVERELAVAGYGSIAEAKTQALRDAAEALAGENAGSLYATRNRELAYPYSKPMDPADGRELDAIESAAQFLRELANA